jgi:hypothetical protein
MKLAFRIKRPNAAARSAKHLTIASHVQLRIQLNIIKFVASRVKKMWKKFPKVHFYLFKKNNNFTFLRLKFLKLFIRYQ